jgi:hypothetical protein
VGKYKKGSVGQWYNSSCPKEENSQPYYCNAPCPPDNYRSDPSSPSTRRIKKERKKLKTHTLPLKSGSDKARGPRSIFEKVSSSVLEALEQRQAHTQTSGLDFQTWKMPVLRPKTTQQDPVEEKKRKETKRTLAHDAGSRLDFQHETSDYCNTAFSRCFLESFLICALPSRPGSSGCACLDSS